MSNPVRAVFVMEQHVGHRTLYENLRAAVDADSRLAVDWVEVTYTGSLTKVFGRIPFLGQVAARWTGVRQVRRGLAKSDATVAFFATQVPATLAGRFRRRRPYVLCTDITPRQYDDMGEHYGHRPDRFAPLRATKAAINRRVFVGAEHIVPWSSWVTDSLIADYGVPIENITVVPPGIDLQSWNPRSDAHGSPVRVLFVGGHFERKGGDSLLAAFHALPAGAACLDIVTKSAGPTPVEGQVAVHRDLDPNSDELRRLFSACDVFVMPTRADAFGIVAIEAAASGLPVIMSRVGGSGDIVVPGETGFLVDIDDAAALTTALHDLVSDPDLRAGMALAARRRAETHFDAMVNASRIVDIVLDTLHNDG